MRDTAKRTWKRWVRTGAFGLLLQSDDRQSVVLYSGILGGTKHRVWIENDLLNISQGQDTIRFEEHVRVVSGREVKRRFHADSIFVLELPIEPQTLADESYTRCAMLYLSRKGRAYMGFAFFFTEEGYRRKAEYMSALDGAVCYEWGRWHKSK